MALDLSATATKLMKKLGGDNFAIIRVRDMPINPETGLPYLSFSVPLVDDLSIHSFYLPPIEESTVYYGALIEYDQALIGGSNIQSGDKRLLLEPKADYQLGDIIQVINGYNSGKHTPVNAKPFEHAGVIQYWDIQLRRQ